MNLASLAQELTEPHLKIKGKAELKEVVKKPAALGELRKAITHSIGEGGDSSDGKPLPLDGKALQLLMDMERIAGEDHENRYGERYFGSLEGLIKKIGKDEHEGEWAAWFPQIFQQWIDDIHELLHPTKVRRLDGIACPACQQTIHGKERETCLVVNCYEDGTKDIKKLHEWTAECRGCGAKWGNEKMAWFRLAIANG